MYISKEKQTKTKTKTKTKNKKQNKTNKQKKKQKNKNKTNKEKNNREGNFWMEIKKFVERICISSKDVYSTKTEGIAGFVLSFST